MRGVIGASPVGAKPKKAGYQSVYRISDKNVRIIDLCISAPKPSSLNAGDGGGVIIIMLVLASSYTRNYKT